MCYHLLPWVPCCSASSYLLFCGRYLLLDPFFVRCHSALRRATRSAHKMPVGAVSSAVERFVYTDERSTV